MATKTNEQRAAERLIASANGAAAKLILEIGTLKKEASKNWYWGQKNTMEQAEKAANEALKLLQKVRYNENN
jgi:hypothetical protein